MSIRIKYKCIFKCTSPLIYLCHSFLCVFSCASLLKSIFLLLSRQKCNDFTPIMNIPRYLLKIIYESILNIEVFFSDKMSIIPILFLGHCPNARYDEPKSPAKNAEKTVRYDIPMQSQYCTRDYSKASRILSPSSGINRIGLSMHFHLLQQTHCFHKQSGNSLAQSVPVSMALTEATPIELFTQR